MSIVRTPCPPFPKSFPCNHTIFLPLKPATFSPTCSIHSIQSCGVHVELLTLPLSSGEIHVIVGLMFDGKTTNLLCRIESESSNGSFQVEPYKSYLQLDKTLKGLCISGRLREAVGLLCTTGVRVEPRTYALLLQECIFAGMHIDGIFQVEPYKSYLQLDKTLKGFCISGRLREAVGLLCTTGVRVEPRTYALLLQECIFVKEYTKWRRIHALMVVVGYDPSDIEKSLVSWNAMIAGYVQKGLEEVGLNLYYKMRQTGFIPDQYTFASVFRACATLATLEHGKQAHGVMIKSQIRENVVVNSGLTDMYFKCSSLSDGHWVFDKSLNRNVVMRTALISGYGQHGKVVEVLESFHRMKTGSHRGLLDEGWAYFSSMTKDYGIQPRGQHYAAIVDLLGHAGQLQEANELGKACKEHSVI
ncbi:pentatricopeptide repeat-containing protein [Quercus suber]|uniref:Pentatricopeptide repeat-containing protein n=1 Tax=Quercus suber TaxID=58331 RepID=A0AAW0K7J5_QUESU